tara:strand:- start:231 stop:368 length:138 start_codon:yes stop_codon:yes gene_type:complete
MKIHWSIDDRFQGWNGGKKDLTNFRNARTELQEYMKRFINEMEQS